MNKNLLIVGAGVYGLVAKEIAESMNCFDKIAFVDDARKITPDGIETVGGTCDIKTLINDYQNVVVAMGNPSVRISLLQKLESLSCEIVTLVSPYAYVAPSAQIGKGCIIEPMAVVHTQARLCKGCLISAGAVVNHASVCEEGVHVDCNATVIGDTVVPFGTKVCSGQVFKNA